MGTILKYVIYIFVLLAIYLIGMGLYEGSINQDTTVGEVVNDVEQGTKRIIKDGYNATKNVIDNGYGLKSV